MKKPFQATVVRYVHDVLTGEFINVGVVLLCPEANYLGASFLSQWSRVTAAFPNAELPHIRRIASVIEDACGARRLPPNVLPLPLLGELDVFAFLRKVIAGDDASIQFSPALCGITDNPDRTLAELRKRYAEKYIPEDGVRVTRNEGQIWQDFASRIASRGDLLQHLGTVTLRSPGAPGYQHEFERAWKNGKWNIAQPVSLDMIEPRLIREKAMLWTGRVMALHPSGQNAEILFLVGMPPRDVPEAIHQAASDAVQILNNEDLVGEARVFTEDHSDELAAKMERDIAHVH